MMVRKLVALGSLALAAATLLGADAPGPAPGSAPGPAPETGKGPWLFSYFGDEGAGLHLAWSDDGLKFTPLHNDKPLLTPTLGGKLMRDPCMRQGSDGVWHLVWTTGWSDQGFGVASSKDLLHWSDQRFVDAMTYEATAQNTWAPELFYDDIHAEWLIFWASTIPEKFKETALPGGDLAKGVILNHRMYYCTTKDFITFSGTKLFYDPGFNCIDATITKAGDKHYVMVIKDETKVPEAKKNLRVATAESPQGPWSKASAPISVAWVEGPTIAKVGDGWTIYYDMYTAHKYGALQTTDWKTFKDVGAELAMPKGARHGTVTPISAEQLATLKAAAAQ